MESMHENQKSDSGCICSDQSDCENRLLLAFLKGVVYSHEMYQKALVKAESGPFHRSQVRERMAAEIRSEVERLLSPFCLWVLGPVAFAEGADAHNIKQYNEMAERAWRGVRGLEQRKNAYQLLSALASRYGKRICEYCWKLLPADVPAAKSVCSRKCEKGLQNRREYRRRQER
jgi:hypothetical protein